MRWQWLLMVLVVPLLGACGSVYRPLQGGVGFMEVPVGADGYQISYVGDTNMSATEARRYTLLRAAELATLRGEPYFRITEEHIYMTYGDRYWPGTDTRFVETFGDRRGRTRVVIHHMYDPGYTEIYMVPESEMQVQLTKDGAAPAIPAVYVLQQALVDGITLSPGVEERMAALPAVTGTVMVPAAPVPTTKPGM
jgi:hypothetical protein